MHARARKLLTPASSRPSSAGSRTRGPARTRASAQKFGLLFGGFAFVFTLAQRLQLLFAAFGTFGGALDQFRTHQLDHGLLGSIAFAIPQAHDASIAAGALAESRP